MSELQRRVDVSSSHGEAELPSLRTYRGGSEKMSGMRERRANLRRIRNGKGGVDGRAIVSESAGATHGRRFNDAQGSLPRNVAKLSFRKDRHPGRDANDREGPAFSERNPGRNHQRRSGATSS